MSDYEAATRELRSGRLLASFDLLQIRSSHPMRLGLLYLLVPSILPYDLQSSKTHVLSTHSPELKLKE